MSLSFPPPNIFEPRDLKDVPVTPEDHAALEEALKLFTPTMQSGAPLTYIRTNTYMTLKLGATQPGEEGAEAKRILRYFVLLLNQVYGLNPDLLHHDNASSFPALLES